MEKACPVVKSISTELLYDVTVLFTCFSDDVLAENSVLCWHLSATLPQSTYAWKTGTPYNNDKDELWISLTKNLVTSAEQEMDEMFHFS